MYLVSTSVIIPLLLTLSFLSCEAPKFDFVSNARPSLFAYPPPTKPPTKEAVSKLATVELSTTAKAKLREKTKEKEKAAESMDTVRLSPRFTLIVFFLKHILG